MSPKLQAQIAKSKEQALAAFIAKNAEIDAMVTRLQELSDDHFNYGPDEVTWSHVGSLEHYAERSSASPTRPSTRATTPDSGPRSPAPAPRGSRHRGSGS